MLRLSVLALLLLVGCTIKHQIEPSEKPFQVNLNVKIDHEVKVKIAEQNKDFLNLEEEYMKKQKAQNKGNKQ